MNLEHAINAAARAQWEAWTSAAYPVVPVRRWDHLSDTERDDVRALVRPIVEAAAPHLVSSALRDAAGNFRDMVSTGGSQIDVLLREWADEIQAVTR